MKTELQIERIARCEGQVTTAQDRVELTETELTHLVGGSGNKPTPILLTESELTQLVGGSGTKSVPILMTEAELSQLVGGSGDTGIGDTGSGDTGSGDSEESGKATPILLTVTDADLRRAVRYGVGRGRSGEGASHPAG